MQVSTIKLSRLAIAAGLMVLAGAASAQAVTSGGATLPQLMYQDIFTNGPIQGVWSYNGTGSGGGKTAFLTNNASLFGTTGTVHIIGSDSALTSAEVSAYNTAYNNGVNSTVANYGRLVQVPAIATPVLLPYKEAGVTALNLSTEQICRIFSYDSAARNWSQVTTAADDGGVGSASAIEVVYRIETSGTTELLSRFLNAACAPYLPSGKSFTISNNFKTVVASALSLTAGDDTNGDGLPDVWVGASGSSGVNTALGQPHRLGFLTPDPNVYTGKDNSVVARINSYQPSAAVIQNAIAALTPPATAIARGNPLNWVPAYALPTTSYPIYGTTNLVLGQCYAGGAGAGTSAAAVKNFLSNLNSGAYDAYINAHNFVKLPSNWNTAIAQAFLTAGSTLEVNATSVCAGIGR